MCVVRTSSTAGGMHRRRVRFRISSYATSYTTTIRYTRTYCFSTFSHQIASSRSFHKTQVVLYVMVEYIYARACVCVYVRTLKIVKYTRRRLSVDDVSLNIRRYTHVMLVRAIRREISYCAHAIRSKKRFYRLYLRVANIARQGIRRSRGGLTPYVRVRRSSSNILMCFVDIGFQLSIAYLIRLLKLCSFYIKNVTFPWIKQYLSKHAQYDEKINVVRRLIVFNVR